jgi:hypothetical protein
LEHIAQSPVFAGESEDRLLVSDYRNGLLVDFRGNGLLSLASLPRKYLRKVSVELLNLGFFNLVFLALTLARDLFDLFVSSCGGLYFL